MAVAALLQGPVLSAPRRARQVDAEARPPHVKRLAVAGEAGRHGAVEGVDAPQCALDEVEKGS